jgi:predicted Zn-dependent protease
MYGFCLLRAGKLKEADEQLSKAFALDPKMPRTLMNLASAKESEGQLPAAIDLLEQFLKVYPNGEYAVKAKQRLEALKIEMTRREGEGGSVGKPDYFSEATAPGVARWADSYMPMKIFIAPASEVKSYKPAFANALREAFKQWVDASGGAISVRYVDAPSADGVTCSFIDDPHQISNPTEGGEARISFDSSGIIRKARLKICTQNSATGTPEEGDLVKNLCLHEVGHILGLTNHSSDNHDVMFGFRAYPANTKLSDRDKATIRKLYAQQSKAQQ